MTHLRRLSRIPGTYFVTSNTWQRRPVFLKEPPARLFLDSLFHYRDEGNFKLHAFVLMPDHFHLLLTPSPQITLERAMQLIKGGSSHRVKQELGYKFPLWQTGFDDHRIRSRKDFEEHVRYIHDNPVEAGLAASAASYAYSSAHPHFALLLNHWDMTDASAAKAELKITGSLQPG